MNLPSVLLFLWHSVYDIAQIFFSLNNSLGEGTPTQLEIFLFIFTTIMPWILGVGGKGLLLLSAGLTQHASLGGAGWRFSWTQAPVSSASFSLWSSSFTHFRKQPRLLECLICSVLTLILLARILPLSCLQQCQPHAQWPCRLVQFCHGDSGGASLYEQRSLPWCLRYHQLVDSHVCGQRNSSTLSKRPREHIAGTSPLSLSV